MPTGAASTAQVSRRGPRPTYRAPGRINPGSLHGGAALEVSDLLTRIATPADAYPVLDRLTGLGHVPGLGHRVYRHHDPRADHLLSRLTAVAEDDARVAVARATLEAAGDLGLPFPNVDFALAALLFVMGVPRSAAPTLFSFARISGLLAHGLEEYPHRLRFRPRATYVGPVPQNEKTPGRD